MSKANVVNLYEAGRPTPYHVRPPHSQPADADIALATPQIRDWARHLAANSSIAKAVFDSRVVNGIGTGLTYEPMVRDRQGNLVESLNNEIRAMLQEWRRDPDVSGQLSGGELERLLWRAWDTDGEVFLRQVIRQTSNAPFPYQVQVIESDQVPIGTLAGSVYTGGVEIDEWGRPVRYHVYPYRGNLTYITLANDPVTIPAASMRHLKRIIRPNQTRGITLLHAVIFRIADIAEYAQSHRLAARASEDLFASINRGPDYQIPVDPDGNEPQDSRNWNFERLQILDGLGPDESVNFHAPQHPNQAATDFLNTEMRQVAAGTRSSFSQIAYVFDRAYAAQRLEIVHAWRLVEQDRAQFIQDLARPALYEEPLRMAIAAGRITIPQRGVDQRTLYHARIEGPVMPTIDPAEDRKADEMDQVNGWDSRQAIIRKRGRTPAEVDGERKQDKFLNQETSNADTGQGPSE